MHDPNSAERPALILLACIVTMVVAAVVGWGAANALRTQRPQTEMMQSSTLAAAFTFQVVFAVGAEKMPQEALDVLGAAADKARERSSGSMIISAFHESPQDADLARRRAVAVQHGLESLGIPTHLIQIAPVQAVKKVSESDANRVDIDVD